MLEDKKGQDTRNSISQLRIKNPIGTEFFHVYLSDGCVEVCNSQFSSGINSDDWLKFKAFAFIMSTLKDRHNLRDKRAKKVALIRQFVLFRFNFSTAE